MPKYVLRPVWKVHREHIVTSVKVREIAPYACFPDDVFRCAGTDHKVGESLEFVLFDEVLDEESGAVATVTVATVRAPVGIRYY